MEISDVFKERQRAIEEKSAARKLHFAGLDAPYAPIFAALRNFPQTGDNYEAQPDACGHFIFDVDGLRRTIRFVDNTYNDNYAWRSSNEPTEFLRNDPEHRMLGHTFIETVQDHLAAPRFKRERYHPACILELEVVSRASLNALSLSYTDKNKTHIAILRADKPAACHNYKNSEEMLAALSGMLSQPSPPILLPDFDKNRIITPSITVYPVSDTDKIAADLADWVQAMAIKPLTASFLLQQLAIETAPEKLSEAFNTASRGKAVAAFETALKKHHAAYEATLDGKKPATDLKAPKKS